MVNFLIQEPHKDGSNKNDVCAFMVHETYKELIDCHDFIESRHHEAKFEDFNKTPLLQITDILFNEMRLSINAITRTRLLNENHEADNTIGETTELFKKPIKTHNSITNNINSANHILHSFISYFDELFKQNHEAIVKNGTEIDLHITYNFGDFYEMDTLKKGEVIVKRNKNFKTLIFKTTISRTIIMDFFVHGSKIIENFLHQTMYEIFKEIITKEAKSTIKNGERKIITVIQTKRIVIEAYEKSLINLTREYKNTAFKINELLYERGELGRYNITKYNFGSIINFKGTIGVIHGLYIHSKNLAEPKEENIIVTFKLCKPIINDNGIEQQIFSLSVKELNDRK